MPGPGIRRLFTKTRVALLGILAAAGAWAFVSYKNADAKPLPKALVRRMDFDALVLAAGRIESANMTDIKCSLKRLGAGSSATILSLIEDGTNVKAGQILCEIDSTDYQELVRRQTITVTWAKASHEQARLKRDVAKIGLESYLQGELTQTEQMDKGQITLAKADLVQREDRLAWTKRMVEKGYFSVQQAATEEQGLMKTSMSLAQTESAFGIHQRFSAPMTRRALESEVKECWQFRRKRSPRAKAGTSVTSSKRKGSNAARWSWEPRAMT